jgi:hypothetical protein
MGTCVVLDHTLMENEKAHRVLFRVSVCVSLPVSSFGRILEQTFSTISKIILYTGSRVNIMTLFPSTSVAVAVGGWRFWKSRRCRYRCPTFGKRHFNSIRHHPIAYMPHFLFFFLWLRLFQCALSYRAVYQTIILEYGLCRDGGLCMRRG